jgi:uncharacterized protein YcfJ
MTRFLSCCTLSAGLALAGVAAAQAPAYDSYDQDQNYVWARVLSVEPILARRTSPEAEEVCWEQPVSYYQPGRSYPTHRRDPTTGTVIGALVGGALGSQIGSGSGRTAATIAGAAAGGKIGHDVAGRQVAAEPDARVEGYERVCETRTTQRTQDRIIGYDVAYELEGERFHARTDAHPGDQIRVAVVPYDE